MSLTTNREYWMDMVAQSKRGHIGRRRCKGTGECLPFTYDLFCVFPYEIG